MRSSEINELALALSMLQGEVQDAFKGKSGYNFSYADLASVLEIARPLLAKNKLAIIQSPYDATDGFVGIETTLMHQSGQYIKSEFSMPIAENKGMSKAQSAGSVITYMRRYSLTAMLGITQTDDLDKSASAEPSYNGDIAEEIKRAKSIDGLKELWGKLNKSQQAEYVTQLSEAKKALAGNEK